MKKSYIFAAKDDHNRSKTVSKVVVRPPTKIVPQTYKYYVGLGNNPHLIRKIMSTRKQWEQVVDSKSLLLSFKWQQSNRGYLYECNSMKRPYRQILNHFEYHQELSNKQYLFKNVVEYCQMMKMNAFQFLPITFILNTFDSNFESQQSQFLSFYYQITPPPQNAKAKTTLNIIRRSMLTNSLFFDKKIHTVHSKYQFHDAYTNPSTKALWILKPTFLNRGNGIHVFSSISQLEVLMTKYIRGTTQQPNSLVKTMSNSNIIQSTSFIIQKYMERPLLFQGRKFDIRVWVLLDHQMKAYFFKQGYMRTSSNVYTTSEDKITDLAVHLTNNAVQKYNSDYNKFQKGNQLSFKALRMLLENKGKDFDEFVAQMKALVRISLMAARRRINRMERDNCFEIFGYDFMVDDLDYKPWLIEVNTNPCLQQSSPLLEQLLPRMLDDAFCLTLDKIFPSPKTTYSYVVENEPNNENMWQLLVDLKKN